MNPANSRDLTITDDIEEEASKANFNGSGLVSKKKKTNNLDIPKNKIRKIASNSKKIKSSVRFI